jgi:hypothetical protein
MASKLKKSPPRKRRPKPAKKTLILKIRKYERDEKLLSNYCDVWLLEREGAVQSGLMWGHITITSLSYVITVFRILEADGVPFAIEEESSPIEPARGSTGKPIEVRNAN